MRIIIDGERVPVNVRVSRDLLLALKSIAKTLRWRIRYDAANEIVYLYSPSYSLPTEQTAVLEELVPESSRLSGKVICLDPGHGGSDPGAIGPSGTLEKDNNLAIALLLREKLESNGCTVIMTRDNDIDVFGPDASASEELAARVDIANEANADIFVSIHNDAFTNSDTSGTTTFHYGSKEAINLANHIQKNVVRELGTKNRNVRFGSFFVIRYTNMPAVLVEVAFISNPEEELLLASCDSRAKAAQSICDGIMKYFKV